MKALFWKELADHFGRRRFVLLLGLVGIGLLWGSFVDVSRLIDEGRAFIFLDVFSTSTGVPISLLSFISFFGPVIGIALGFDSINGERTQGTLSRLLAQPIYRDSVFNAKLLAAILTLSLVVASVMMVVVGITMFRLGIPPTPEEILRLVGFYSVTMMYLSFWLALSITTSVLFRNTVTSALASIGAWFSLGFLVTLFGGVIADRIVPEIKVSAYAIRHLSIESWINRASPSGLFSEATTILLDPMGGRALNFFSIDQSRLSGLLSTPVSAVQSLQLIWPHIVVLLGMVALLIALSYFKFMREEIRA